VVTHSYQPVGSARELFLSHDDEVLLSGSAGTGKTRACLEKVHMMCLRYPGMRALVLRKTAVSLASTALVTYREIVAREALASGEVVFYSGSRDRAAAYHYASGSTITVGGLDRATRIMSSEYDIVYVGESTELIEDDWEMVTTRLRNGRTPFMQLIADCNPSTPNHWLKKRCDAGKTRMIFCRHEDNPRYFRDGHWTPEGSVYLGRLDALTGARRERLRYGKWTAAEGLVYEMFDPAVHISDRFNYKSHPPQDWPRYLAVDFGFRNPLCAAWWTEDPDGRLYLYKEIYQTGLLVEDAAAKIAKMMKTQHGPEPRFQAVICDHDAEDRATLERHLGYSTTAANKTVSEGIQAVQERLRVQADGKPRLYLCRDAVADRDQSLADAGKPSSTVDEITGYIWDPSAAPGSGGATQREVPLKKDDHGMDQMRYMTAHTDLTGRTRLRWF
jgi:phage terminase large subunit